MSDFFSDNGENDPFWSDPGGLETAAEEAAPEPEATVEPDPPVETAEPEQVEEPPAGRPRNPDGTFAKAETDPEPEPEATDASALQAQIAQLEKRLADKDEFAGRMSNELGELRKLQEQIAEQQSRPQVSDWDNLIDDNPFRAYQIALQANDQYRAQQAREAWNDLAPGAPDLYDANRYLYNEIASLKQQVTDTTGPLQAQQQTQQVALAYQQIKDKYPDWDTFEDAMAEAVETRPLLKESLTKVLSSGDTAQQVAVLEDLYLITAGRKSDTLREAKQQAAQEFAQETLKAKQDAIVASATSTPVEQPKSRHDDLWDMAQEVEDARAAGWNLGPR